MNVNRFPYTRLSVFLFSRTITPVDQVEFARLGAIARNKSLSKKQRTAAARHAVNARWRKYRAAEAAKAVQAKQATTMKVRRAALKLAKQMVNSAAPAVSKNGRSKK